MGGFEANHAHYSQTRVCQGDPACRPLFLRDPMQNKFYPGGRREKFQPQSLIDLAAGTSRRAQHPPQDRKPRERFAVFNGSQATGRSAPTQPMRRPAAKALARFCPYCGGSAESFFKFCQHCGENLAADEEWVQECFRRSDSPPRCRTVQIDSALPFLPSVSHILFFALF